MTCKSTISVVQGDTYKRSFIFEDSTGNPINLTGSTIRFHLGTDPVTIQTLTITDAINGKASLTIVLNLPIGSYLYEYEWTDSGWRKRTLDPGTLYITPQIA